MTIRNESPVFENAWVARKIEKSLFWRSNLDTLILSLRYPEMALSDEHRSFLQHIGNSAHYRDARPRLRQLGRGYIQHDDKKSIIADIAINRYGACWLGVTAQPPHPFWGLLPNSGRALSRPVFFRPAS
jgi:hypothetical protein